MQIPTHRQILAHLGSARDQWGPSPPRDVVPEPAGPDRESVWSYPRPPLVRELDAHVVVRWGATVVAETRRALEIVETAGAPVPYIAPEDVAIELLRETGPITLCEWKGAAVHYDLVQGAARLPAAAFCYPDPLTDLERGYERVAGWFGFYPAKLDCFINQELAVAQPGGLYAGWMTSRIAGPVKGAPGTGHW